MSWYPVAVGLTAALAIVPLRNLFKQRLLDRARSDTPRIVFFFFCGLLLLAGIPFLDREDFLVACGVIILSSLFIWAAFGTIFKWPGFRPPLEPNQCARCRYDLTGNTNGVCPECGNRFHLQPLFTQETEVQNDEL
jgi:hypothetical protein